MDLKTMPKWAKVLGGCFVAAIVAIGTFIAIVFFIAFSATSGPVKAAELYLDLGSSEIYDSSYQLTADDFRAVTTQDSMMALFESNTVLADMEDVSFSHRSINDDLAIIWGEVSSATETSPIYMELVFEGEDWHVSYISLDPYDIPVEE